MKYLAYKGYLGTVELDIEQDCLFGKLAFIRDLVTYEANTLSELKQEFQISVEEYLSSCEELGRTSPSADPFFSEENIVRLGKSIAELEETGGTIHDISEFDIFS